VQILHYTINGTFDSESGSVVLKKQYSSRFVPEDLVVKYEGKLSIGEDGQPVIAGGRFCGLGAKAVVPLPARWRCLA